MRNLRLVRSILILFLILLIADCVSAQKKKTAHYTIRFTEKIAADYDNLLDTVSARKFKTFERVYIMGAGVEKISDSLIYIGLVLDSIDTGDKVKIGDEGNRKIDFLFSYSRHNRAASDMYFEIMPPAQLLNLAKNFVSNISFFRAFCEPDEYQEEPYIDGFYRIKYTRGESSSDRIVIKKQKKAIYLPGINVFRNIVDSFKSYFVFDKRGEFLEKAVVYEEKRQKMGSRILSSITSTIEVTNIRTDLRTSTRNRNSTGFILKIPVYNELTYAERLYRISKSSTNNIPADRLGREIESVTDINAGQLSIRLRSSLVAGTLRVGNLRPIFDSCPVSSLCFRVLEDALVESATSEAQEMIAELLARKNETDFFYKRLLIKAGVTAPITSPVLLKQMFLIKKDTVRRSLSAVAGLALANNSILLGNDGKYDTRTEIISFLEKCFKSSEDKRTDTIQWLQESGNAANASVLSLVKYCLEQDIDDQELFTEAVYSLRFIDDSGVDTILAMQLLAISAESLDWLVSIYKLRYPAYVIRSAIYTYLTGVSGNNIAAAKQFIEYLASWKNEVKEMKLEIANLKLENTGLKNYAAAAFQ